MRSPSHPPQLFSWQLGDGTSLRGRLWRPLARSAHSAVVYLHGIQSHGGWFEWSASLLASGGRLVLLPDRRGSGLNAEDRGDSPSAERWLDDLDDLAAWAQAEFGVQRFDVVGVSWGGKPAVAWALRRPELVGRVLLIAPGLFPAVDIGLRGRLGVGVSLVTRHPRQLTPIPLDDPALFTDNPAGRRFIGGDELKLTHVTARFLFHSARLDRMLVRAAKGSLRADAELVLAGRDRIIRNVPTEAWLRRLSASAPVVHTLAEAAHTLEFEVDVSVFEGLLLDWVQNDR